MLFVQFPVIGKPVSSEFGTLSGPSLAKGGTNSAIADLQISPDTWAALATQVNNCSGPLLGRLLTLFGPIFGPW